MSTKVFVVTNATSAPGKALAAELAKTGEVVVMVAPDAERGNPILQEVRLATQNFNVSLELCDLSILSSVRNLAEILKSKYEKIDVLIHHAGVFHKQRKVTVDGFEGMFAANYLGPFLLTNLLLESLQAAVQVNGAAHVLNITQPAAAPLNFEDLQSEQNFQPRNAFESSQTANLLFTLALARKLESTGITVNAVHPGAEPATRSFSPLRLFRWLRPGPSVNGSANIARVATGSEFEKMTGKFLQDGEEIAVPAYAHDLQVQQRLWDLSEQLTKLTDTKGGLPVNDPNLYA
jgi:NAD(P)-dependent dehydrogenase (short-subunit alcohol dehydrogenase family)